MPAEFSVVVPTYNRCTYLQDCVESIRESAAPFKAEIIVVDGGSADGTIEWCITQGDIVLIEQGELLGAMSAFNAGFAKASAELVAHLNDDAMCEEKCLYRAVEHLRDHPETGQVIFRFRDEGWAAGNYRPGTITSKNHAEFGMTRAALGNQIGWFGTGSYTYDGSARGTPGLSSAIRKLGYNTEVLLDCRVFHLRLEDALREINYWRDRPWCLKDKAKKI